MPFLLMCARTARAVPVILSLVVAQPFGRRALAQSPARLLDQVVFELTSVEDSSQYFVYRYRIRNPVSSKSGVAGISVELSAPPGTGATTLPSTGRYVHGADAGVGPISDHVPVGVINPPGWTSGLARRNAILSWAPREGYYSPNGPAVAFSEDSAPPGGSREGFGLRSPFLLGPRRFSARPTLASCCSANKLDAHGDYLMPGQFRVGGYTAAPTVRPQDMSLAVVQSNLQQACASLGWIRDGALCSNLRSKLEQAVGALRRDDSQAAKGSLRLAIDELEAQHGSGKPVNDNAYWLLKANAAYLLAHM